MTDAGDVAAPTLGDRELAALDALGTRRSVAAQNRRDVEPVDSPEVIILNRAA